MPTLDDAITVIRTGNTERGREILEEILETDESNEEVWLWLSSVVESDEDREICLENVLAINPDNIVAKKGLEALQQGTFNVHNIMEDALGDYEEIEEDDDDFGGGTFLDEFTMADEDDELEFPSTMKSPKKGGGLNVRIILIVALVLCVVLALGGAAAYNVILGGDGGDPGPVDPPAQDTPTDGGQPGVETTETPVSEATPTDTPTPTNTPFKLPTKEPTPEPTPTATIVVSPTSPS